METFRRKRAVVTGAASGIGRALAIELARRGAELTLVDRDEVGARDTAILAEACGARTETLICDLADDAALDAACAKLAHGPSVDLLVNNAGIAVVAPFLATSREDWQRIVSVNTKAPIALMRALLPEMIERKTGHLLTVASLAGLTGAPGMTAYSTTKHALMGFIESLRYELEGTNVGTTTVCPGYVRTSLHANTKYDNEGFRRFLDAPPDWYGLTPETVATRACDAVLREGALVTLGPEKIGWVLKRLSPSLAYQIAKRVVARQGIVATHTRPLAFSAVSSRRGDSARDRDGSDCRDLG